MILSFWDKWLSNFYLNDIRSRYIPTELEDRLFRKLQMIDDSTTDQDLRVPPSNHFKSFVALYLTTILFVSTINGGLFLFGTVPKAKLLTFILTIIAIDKSGYDHDHKAQASRYW